MHIFRLFVTAGQNHPTHAAGTEMDAICMVDSSDMRIAHQKATDRLTELGWASATFRDTTLLPPDPDISGFNQVMREAFGHARDTGVSLIVYPEKSVAA
jgi:hypothetical protein